MRENKQREIKYKSLLIIDVRKGMRSKKRCGERGETTEIYPIPDIV
jgi:hypothetical protein